MPALVSKLLLREQRKKAREVARRSWIKAEGDIPTAKRLAKQEINDGVGSFVVALTVAVLMLQLCYTAFKFWKEINCKVPPEEPQPNEPFDLT